MDQIDRSGLGLRKRRTRNSEKTKMLTSRALALSDDSLSTASRMSRKVAMIKVRVRVLQGERGLERKKERLGVYEDGKD